jgi:hypothetical protein
MRNVTKPITAKCVARKMRFSVQRQLQKVPIQIKPAPRTTNMAIAACTIEIKFATIAIITPQESESAATNPPPATARYIRKTKQPDRAYQANDDNRPKCDPDRN